MLRDTTQLEVTTRDGKLKSLEKQGDWGFNLSVSGRSIIEDDGQWQPEKFHCLEI